METLLDTIGLAITDIQESWTARQMQLVVMTETTDQSVATTAKKLQIAPNTYYKIKRAGRLDLHENLWKALVVAAAEIDRKAGLK